VFRPRAQRQAHTMAAKITIKLMLCSDGDGVHGLAAVIGLILGAPKGLSASVSPIIFHNFLDTFHHLKEM